MGPTATGKSEVAVRLAETFGGDVVGCDSMQVYRGLDAGTGKPDAALRSRAAHHLIDVADPAHDFNLGDYVRMAEKTLDAIASAGRVAVVAGGTGLYLRGLLRGVFEGPPRDEALRARLLAIPSRRGAQALHRILRRWDPPTASRLAPRDTQRIVRALEVVLLTRKPMSEHLAAETSAGRERVEERDGVEERDHVPGAPPLTGPARSGARGGPRGAGGTSQEGPGAPAPPTKSPLWGQDRWPAVKIGLRMPRDLHVNAIEARVDRFLASSWADEVRGLVQSGLPETANCWKALGYRDVRRFVRGEIGLDEARASIVRETRQYAKRQMTWFRAEPGVQWFEHAGVAPWESIHDWVAVRIGQPGGLP